MEAVGVQISTLSLTFTICNVYFPPPSPVILTNVQDLLSQLPAHLLLEDFSARYHPWDSGDEDKRCDILETLIFRFNFMVLNTGKHMHIFHSFGTLSCLDLEIYHLTVSCHNLESESIQFCILFACKRKVLLTSQTSVSHSLPSPSMASQLGFIIPYHPPPC